jgi:hypothetical protein
MLQDEEGRDQEGCEHDIEPVCFDVCHVVSFGCRLALLLGMTELYTYDPLCQDFIH